MVGISIPLITLRNKKFIYSTSIILEVFDYSFDRFYFVSRQNYFINYMSISAYSFFSKRRGSVHLTWNLPDEIYLRDFIENDT